jgi:hypothetical protein
MQTSAAGTFQPTESLFAVYREPFFNTIDPKRTLAHIYSTMFALSTIDEGMVSPSVFAVFELTVNSNS